LPWIAWGWAAGFGCAAILLWLALSASSSVQFSAPTAAEVVSSFPMVQQTIPEPFWKAGLEWFPAGATLFGALNLKAFGSLTLDDAWTQTVLRLVAGGNGSGLFTPDNLGRIRIDGISLAYYQNPKTKKDHGLLQMDGEALAGRKRIIDFIQQATSEKALVEEDAQKQFPCNRIRVSSSEMPFALGLFDDHKMILARSMKTNARESQHLQALEEIPSFDFAHAPHGAANILSSYNPPWLRTALAEIPPDACGLVLGEIPSEWRNRLGEAMDLRTCPRTFVCYLKKETNGVTLFLSLNVDNAGAELILREDLEKWRLQGLDVLKAMFPGIRKEPAALAVVGKTLKTMRWGANPGSLCVRTRVQVPEATWKALRDLLKRS